MPDYEDRELETEEEGAEDAAAEQEAAAVEGAVDESPAIVQERKTWEGRLRAEQARLANVQAYMAQYGLRIDEHGNVLEPPAPQATQQQQAEDVEDIIDYEDPAVTKRRIKALAQEQASQMVGEAMKAIAPLLGDLYEDRLTRKYTDWPDIRADAEELLRRSGFQSATQAAAMRPDILEMAVLAARGKQLAPPAAKGRSGAAVARPSPGATDERERQRLVAEASTVGGSALRQMKRAGLSFTPEEEQFRRQQGLTEEELAQLVSGPVVIDVLGMKG